MRWPRTKEELEGIKRREVWKGAVVGTIIVTAFWLIMRIIGG